MSKNNGERLRTAERLTRLETKMDVVCQNQTETKQAIGGLADKLDQIIERQAEAKPWLGLIKQFATAAIAIVVSLLIGGKLRGQ